MILQTAPKFNAGTQGLMDRQLLLPVALYSCMVSDIMGQTGVNSVEAQGDDKDMQTKKGGGARRLQKTSE
jgi:hypothetical protein